MSSLFASRKASGLLTVASALLFGATNSAEVESAQLCDQFGAYATPNGQYIFNNNAWGDDGSGAECTTVFNNGSGFATQWKWLDNGNDTHSFPNVQLNSAQLLPLPLKNLSSLDLAATWSMSPIDGNTRANVVYDMFVDTDADTSSNATLAKYEMMIWIGAFDDPFPLGASINPFGVNNDSLPHVKVGDADFTLFSGNNSGGQTVHSWLTTTTNTTDFSGDVTPLVTYLTNNSLMETDAYLGLIQFGSETWHATANVTFNVTNFAINLTSTDASVNKAAAAALVAATASPTSMSTSPSSTSLESSSTVVSTSATGTPTSPSSTSEGSSPVTVILPTSTLSPITNTLSLPSLTLTNTSLIPLPTLTAPPSSSSPVITVTASSPFTVVTETATIKSSTTLTSAVPGSSGASATGGSSSSGSGSGSSTSSGSSSSSSGSSSSGSSLILLPIWFWEIAAAGCLFAML